MQITYIARPCCLFDSLAIFGTHPLASSAIRAPNRKRRELPRLKASYSLAALICARGWLGGGRDLSILSMFLSAYFSMSSSVLIICSYDLQVCEAREVNLLPEAAVVPAMIRENGDDAVEGLLWGQCVGCCGQTTIGLDGKDAAKHGHGHPNSKFKFETKPRLPKLTGLHTAQGRAVQACRTDPAAQCSDASSIYSSWQARPSE